MSIVPESHRDLFDLPAVWHVATIGPGGEPHSSPVWAGVDGTPVRFPHAEGRPKWRNLGVDDRVALSATDPSDQGRYLEVRGRVVAWESDADLGFLDAQCLKYNGVDEFPREAIPADQVRVIAVVQPLRCTTMG
ncbi:MAG: pyridoxamine 5'-phosphate oxidase family protein [Actinomycetota bacterium]|nr:pyridoxamine 5'-phosphate oxidase family protein [Actinomycetota bacterium]